MFAPLLVLLAIPYALLWCAWPVAMLIAHGIAVVLFFAYDWYDSWV